MIFDEIINELILLVQKNKQIDNHIINRVIRKCGGNDANINKIYSKKRLMPYFLKKGASYWQIDSETEKRLLKALQIKPRRTASGVATITVMTKPWKCQSACIYCPNDVRMPKSYLSDEPVCQKAEFVYFDPYLQVMSRLRALKQMGHPTDKIELIILGGTFCDYPKEYQIWYVSELFRALNDSEFSITDDDFVDVSDPENPYKIINNSPIAEGQAKERIECYQNLGLSNLRDTIANDVADIQKSVSNGEISYNQALQKLYYGDTWQKVSAFQSASLNDLESEQLKNEASKHRVVGLVIETRPDTINSENLTLIRRFGCTKVQMGVQSLNDEILRKNHRMITQARIAEAFALLRLFGFKIHIHFMLNLYGSNAKKDIEDYKMLVNDHRFLPDEVKLYPCMLVWGTELVKLHHQGDWQPYDEEELVEVLVQDTMNTPRYCRISRMIRDISAHDIVAGNKKSNLRQVVEQAVSERSASARSESAKSAHKINEIRYREIGTKGVIDENLTLHITKYNTSVSDEYFLEWVTEDDYIVGFLRLSLPVVGVDVCANSEGFDELIKNYKDTAMIREVHIYGKTANLGKSTEGGQHQGLGRKLIAKAEEIATESGYTKIQVISSVGTREYYRSLGFSDSDLYQVKEL